MKKLTPRTLFEYANEFASENEKAGNGTVYPTLRQASKHFKVKISDIEDIVEMGTNLGYLGIIVGVSIPGVGYSDLPRGQWQVEAYE